MGVSVTREMLTLAGSPGEISFAVQLFQHGPEGLRPGTRLAAPSDAEAIATAAAMVPIVAGSVALRFAAGTDAPVTVLARFGNVPHDWVAPDPAFATASMSDCAPETGAPPQSQR